MNMILAFFESSSQDIAPDQAILLALVGIVLIALVLVVLMFVVKIMSLVTSELKPSKTEKSSKSSASTFVSAQPQTTPASVARTLTLKNVSEQDAALIMAIVAHQTNIPIEELNFKSIKLLEEGE